VFEADQNIAEELSKQIASVMESVVEISVPLLVEVGQGQNTVAKGRFNLAALVLLIILYLLKIFGVMYLSGSMPNSPIHLVILTFVTMIQDLIRFCRYLIFATIILSWVVMFTQSRSPYIEVIH